jgi:type I restriction enzyme S subunit
MKKGWEVKKLGEVCQLQLGKTPYRKNPKFWDKEKTSNNIWLSIADLKHGEYISNSAEHVSDLGAKDIVKIPQGTMLLSFKLTLGRVSFAGTDLYTNEAIAALLHLDNILSKEFLFYYFSFFNWDKAAEGDVKIKGKTLNKQKLKELPIIVPPLPEQKRIVAILDEVFAAIDKAKANAEKNLANAKELFESYLNGIFANPGEDWEEKKLGDVCDVIAGQSPEGKFYNNIGNGLPFYQGKKEFTNKYLGAPTTWTTSITKEAIENDILISVRAPVGPVNIATQKICIGRGLAAIRVGTKIERDFLFNFLVKHENDISGNVGAVFNSINKSQIESIKIPLPPLSQQKRIIAKFTELSKEIKQFEEIYQKKISELDELKKSILKKAFEGEL